MIRTDLAMELLPSGDTKNIIPEGVEVKKEDIHGMEALIVKIMNKKGEQTLGKPKGSYITIDVENVLKRKQDSFNKAVTCIAGYIRGLLRFDGKLPVLVVGLGNRAITPDAIGPVTAEHILVTRHMVEAVPKQFGMFRPVSAFTPGVLGTTGVESSESIRAIAAQTKAAAVIAVDAIAARETVRLCGTVQITDTGICPGSGIGNQRNAINRETIGVPVIGIGVPTITDARTLALDLLEQNGIEISKEDDNRISTGAIITCSDIDKRVRELSRVLSYGINLALQEEITADDLNDLIY